MYKFIWPLLVAALTLTISACDQAAEPGPTSGRTNTPTPSALSAQDQKLASISAFVNNVCQAPDQGGYRTETELLAAAEVKGKLVAAKIAETSANASAGRKSARWQGVDQKALADAMRDSRSCAPKTLQLILRKIEL